MIPTLTENDCKYILTKLHPKSTPTINNFELNLAPSDQDGFFGDSHVLKISYKMNNNDKNRIFFVKIFPTLPDNAEMAKNLLTYEKEIFYYRVLVPEYKKLGIKTNFVPECYYFKDEKIIVMENLTVKSYGMKYRFTLDETKSGLKSIAEMHAASILFEEKMSVTGKDFNLGQTYADIFVEKFFDISNPKSFVNIHFKEGFQCIRKLIEYFPQMENCKDTFLEELKKINFDEIFKKDLGLKKVCSHGDLWRRNILFQEGTNHCKIIDFQMLRYYDPVFDVLSFLYFNFPLNSLKNHREDLLRYYYQCLTEYTNTLVETNLPFKDFMMSADHFEILAIYQATVGHTLDIKGNVTDVFFGNRVKYCCKEFEEDTDYRDTLTNDIFCLINYIMKTTYS